MQVNDDTSRALEAIRALRKDVDDFDAHIKTQADMVKEMIETAPESSDIEELEVQLKEKKAQLKSRMMANAAYNDTMSNLADDREARKSALQHLSDALVIWYTLTGNHQIEIDDDEAREVIVSAKLGKEQPYQTSLLEKRNE